MLLLLVIEFIMFFVGGIIMVLMMCIKILEVVRLKLMILDFFIVIKKFYMYLSYFCLFSCIYNCV